MGHSGMMTPAQQGFASTTSPIGGGPSPMPRQTSDTPRQPYQPQQVPYTPAQGRRDSWDVPMQARSVNDDCNTRTLGSRSTPYAREQHQGRRQIMPERYDGTSVEPREYLNQFLVLTELNDWSEEEKGLYLASSLTGVARGILQEPKGSPMGDSYSEA